MSKKRLTLYKYELAEILGISVRTLSSWLNIKYYDELKEKTGYEKTQRLLYPGQIAWLEDKLVFKVDDQV